MGAVTSADAIAQVVADLRADRVVPIVKRGKLTQLIHDVAVIGGRGPIVDASAIYSEVSNKSVRPYEDFPCIAPPWTGGVVAYQNEHGNVLAMPVIGIDYQRPGAGDDLPASALDGWAKQTQEGLLGRWETAEPIDWDLVRWTIDAYVFVGGTDGTGRKIRTRGPFMLWRFAIYESGEPADIHWVNFFPDKEPHEWENCSLVLLGAMNFMNATNTELAEPQRPRAERRRLERLGVRVSTIHVRPMRRSSPRSKTKGEPLSLPLTSVRGHFAHYGDCCPGRHDPKGLAFGKLQGRFWVPQYAKGDAARGEVVQTYKLEPSSTMLNPG